MPKPHCHSIRSLPGKSGEWFCAHPMVHAKSNLVTLGVCSSCQLRNLPPPERFRSFSFSSTSLNERGELELVVAKYREDISWLARYDAISTVVYDKSGAASQYPLANVGREAHTYLHHIVQNYERLAEVTVFLQGYPFDHIPNLDEQIWRVDRNIGFRDLCDHILVEDGCGEPVHPGLGVGEMYEALFDLPSPDFFVSHSSACFAVSRENILNRPKSFYQKAIDLVVRREQGPWEIERLWQFIFETKEQPFEGVVTAADSAFFRDLQLLVHSHRQRAQYPLVIVDLGLTSDQRNWCLTQSNVSILPMPLIYKPVDRIRQQHWWQTWLKPFYLFHSPFDRVLWLDADCVILGNLSQAFEVIENRPLLVRDSTGVVTENHSLLYEYLPLPQGSVVEGVTVNAGVVGLCKSRDQSLLAAWAYGVAWMAMNPGNQSLSAWADQGMLLWALHRTKSTAAIQKDVTWNCPSKPVQNLIADAVENRCSVLDEIRNKHPGASIVHFLGEGKLSQQMADELERLFVKGFEGSQNARHSNVQLLS